MSSPREAVSFILGALITTAAAAMVALFYAGDKSGLWDVLKLAMQGIFAVWIARQTVVWAVEKFKSQKRWERDAQTFASVLASLREMKRVKDIFWDKEVNGTSYTKKYVQEVTERSNLAQKKFEEAAAAAIFLPGKIPVIILNLDAELNKDYGSYSYVEELEEKGHLVSGALMELAAQKHLL
jgi:hypothetical protein